MDDEIISHLAHRILARYADPDKALDYCLQQQDSFASIGNSLGLQLWLRVHSVVEILAG